MKGIDFKYKHIKRPTAEIPIVTERQLRLADKLYNGTLEDLAEELLKIFKEQLAASSLPRDDENRRSVSASMKKVISDLEEGPRDTIELLHSLHPRVTESIIWNTLGHDFLTDESFKKLLYNQAAVGAGIYINTAMIGEEGKGFCIEDWEGVTETMESYAEDHGRQINTHSEVEKKRALDAKKVDEIFGVQHDETKGTKTTHSGGYRRYINGHGKTTIFIKSQKQRIRRDLDPSGKVRQIISPMEVGQSKNIPVRLPAHNSISGLSNATKTWALLLSCLEATGYRPRVVALAILKIWKPSQISIGEILLTIMGSSLVEELGYNVVQAGNRSLNTTSEFREELQDVFFDHSFMEDNIRTSRKLAKARLRGIKNMENLYPDHEAQQMQSIKTNIIRYQTKVEHLHQNLPNSIEETTSSISLLREQLLMLKENNDNMEFNLKFFNQIHTWSATK